MDHISKQNDKNRDCIPILDYYFCKDLENNLRVEVVYFK